MSGVGEAAPNPQAEARQGDEEEASTSLAAVKQAVQEAEEEDAKVQQLRKQGEGQYGCKHYR